MGNCPEVVAEVSVDYGTFPLQQGLLDRVERLVSTASGPVAEAQLVKVGLEDRLEQDHQSCLYYSVFHRWNSERPLGFPISLRYPYSEHRTRPVAPSLQLGLQIIEEGHRVGSHRLRCNPILSGRTFVAQYRLERRFQHVSAAQIAIQRPCPPARVLLRLAVQPPLKDLDLCLSRY